MNSERNVLVTGGDKGIGKAIVEKLASSHRHIVFTYNSNQTGAEELASGLANVSCYQCELGNRERIAEVITAIKDTIGDIDVLINNAACDKDAVFSKMSKDLWDDVLNVNLRSLYDLTFPFVKSMSEKKWGRIVNLTSIAGFTGAFGKSNYAASKAGVVGFTKSLSLELAGKGITVNAIAPGAIATDMLMRIPEKYLATIMQNIPARRFGEPSEVAELIAFLVSDQASYITGQSIHINGGSY